MKEMEIPSIDDLLDVNIHKMFDFQQYMNDSIMKFIGIPLDLHSDLVKRKERVFKFGR